MQATTSSSQERPYRSHLRPACGPCRRRKSRCKIEASSSSCLMCRVHGTECRFPAENEQSSSGKTSSTSTKTSRGTRKVTARRTLAQRVTPTQLGSPSNDVEHGVLPAAVPEPGPSADNISWTGRANEAGIDNYQPTPLATDDSEQENTHIVGPANTTDSQVLADYLSTITTDNGGMRMVRPLPGSRSKPVLFSTVQKRPIGVEITACTNQAREKLNIIEQYLAPWAEQFIEL